MTEKEFEHKYCSNCGTQRCEGIGTEWFEGCPKRWNLDGYGDAAAEIQRLNDKIIELSGQIVKLQSTKITNTKSRCHKCIHELVCAKNLDNEGKCKSYKRDPKDGGYYG